MAESSGQRYERTLIDQVVPILPVAQALETGIDVGDVGFDVSEDAIAVARSEAAGAGLTNLSFEVADAAALDQVGRFEPMSAFMYSVSTMYCMTVSMAHGGEGLGTAWGHQTAVERLTLAGFVDIEVTGVRHDRSNSYFLCTKPVQ